MNDKLHRVIGIDLGTTYSAVAAYNNYTMQAEIIRNLESDIKTETTASVVSLDQILRKAIVGSAAKRNLAVCPDDTVIEIKREMGDLFLDEKALDKFRAKGVFNINDPVKTYFSGQWMLPQEISAFILMKMKEVAKKVIGSEINDAVVTVPAYFKEPQKKATEEAVRLAGLYPRQIIPEPTAAAICYGLDKVEAEKKTYLVYDLGGGTFDVSIIQVETGNLNCIATSGDPRLGGADFDDAITKWIIDELRKHGIEVGNDRIVRAKIRSRAEFAKEQLSYNESTDIIMEFLKPGTKLVLNRGIFLSLIEGYLQKSLNYVDTAINMAKSQQGVDRNQIDAILLVGGSSKIPRVKEMLLDYFHKDKDFVRDELNPDTVVARGAAILATKFAPTEGIYDIKYKKETLKLNTESAEETIIRLKTEHSLSVGVQDNVCRKIIEQGSDIPCEEKKDDFTNPSMASKILVPVFQGEGKFTFENTPIGELQIDGIEPKPAGFHKFEVTFKLDVNGLLTMIVMHVNTNKPYEMHFDQKTGVQGGDDALIAMRNKLLKMYAHESSQTMPSGSQLGNSSDITPPPPPEAISTIDQSSQPQAGSAISAESQVPAANAEITPPQNQNSQTSSVGSAWAGIIEPIVPVPEQFKQLVRRSQKMLMKITNPELLKTFNAFISALNSGVDEKALEEIGDKLADTFDEARE